MTFKKLGQGHRKLKFLTFYIFTWPKNSFFGQVLFSSACMCLWVFISIISKSSWPILMKLSRMVNYDIRQDPFEDGMNQSGRTHTSPIWNVKIAIYYKVLRQIRLNFTIWYVLSFNTLFRNLRNIALIECIPLMTN